MSWENGHWVAEEEEDKDSPENSLESSEYKAKDAVVVLIDASKSMWDPIDRKGADGKNEAGFPAVIRLCQNFLKDRIISSQKDPVAFVFYNSRVTQNASNFRGVNVFLDLDEIDPARILKLQKLATKRDFDAAVGSYDDDAKGQKSDFFQALWACQHIASQKKDAKETSKRLFIFTDKDSPDGADAELIGKAVKKAQDLDTAGIKIELFPLSHPGRAGGAGSAPSGGSAPPSLSFGSLPSSGSLPSEPEVPGKPVTGRPFNYTRFFKQIIPSIDDEYDDLEKAGIKFSQKFEDLESRFKKKQFKKRPLCSVDFQLNKDMSISVKFYSMLREAKPELGSWVEKKTNAQLTCVTKWLCTTTASYLEDSQMRKHYPYAEEKVYFTKEEMETIKSFGQPGLVLMGFKPRSVIKIWQNMRPPYFIYPDELRIKGSALAFNALLTQMVTMDKVAVARLIYRKNGGPRFVYLVPQAEEIGADGTQIKPPGMHMIFIPFADDIRNPKLPPPNPAPPEMIEKMKTIVKHLKINQYDPTVFENPSLQKHYAVLQAFALREKEPGDLEDLTLPDEKGMNKFAAELQAFADDAGLSGGGGGDGGDDDDDDAPPRRKGGSSSGGRRKKADSDEDDDDEPKKKRKAPSKEKPGAAKKAKKEEKEPVARDWKALIASGGLKKLTIPDLKEYLRANKLPVSGKKDDLIDRITKHAAKK